MLGNLKVFIQGVPNKLLPNVWLNNSVFKEVRYSYLYSAVIMGHSGYFEYKDVSEGFQWDEIFVGDIIVQILYRVMFTFLLFIWF